MPEDPSSRLEADMSAALKILALQNGALEENAYLLYMEGATQGLLIDPGSEPERLIQEIERLKLGVPLILATHGHFDHVGAVDALKRHFKASFAACREDEPVMRASAGLAKTLGLGQSVVPSIDQDLKDGQMISAAGVELKVLRTPGHTPGGCSFYHAPSASLFSGDTLFHASIGRHDAPGGDFEALKRSLQVKIYTLPAETRVFPGHGEATRVGQEARSNPFVRAAQD
jgi:glyoxylase-like metal-dependent hydrolase (beta-lactamase superfamily II)